MKIVEAQLQRVRLPLVHEFETSSHRKTFLEHIMVRLQGDEGSTGWGEIASPSDPFYAPESVDTCWLIAHKYLLPALVGAEWKTPEQAASLWSKVRGNEFAKAGVDAAVWALHAAATGLSLSHALGGTRAEAVAGVSLGIESTIGQLIDQVRFQLNSGYSRIKLKIRPGWDVAAVHAVRAEFSDITLQVDANGAYTESAHDLEALRALDRYRLAMIEQPFAPRNLLAHARLQAQLETAICLDESIETLADLETAFHLEAARVINIKVSRMGGLTPARAAHDMAVSAGIPVWCGGMHEFGVGRAANLALSSLPGFTLPSDVSGSNKYYARDVTTTPIVAKFGIVEIPTAPGLGFEIDEEFVAAHTVETHTTSIPQIDTTR